MHAWQVAGRVALDPTAWFIWPSLYQAPDADGPTIKRAYYSIMKDCHPDQSGGEDDEATEFCKMLNEIYEVGDGPASAPG